MIKLTTLLISCSLALAGAALAQETPPEGTPAAKKGAGKGRGRPAAAQNAPNAPAGAANPAGPGPAAAPQKNAVPPSAAKRPVKPAKADATVNPPAKPEATAAGAPPAGKGQAKQGGKGMKGDKPAPSAAPAAVATPAPTAVASAAPSAAPAAPPVAQAGQGQPKGKALKKPDQQQVQQIKAKHANFRAQPRPQQVPTVTFQAGYRIQGADRWQGPQYEVYRSYRPERHDRAWYHQRYQRVELVGGGYYYWNSGYWYPAWGYSPAEEYYAYDAPIYVGQGAEPPDRVIANVQATLQEMGYYKGEVDGLLGPLTREALVGYQNDQGLVATAVMDAPTLDSLGMG